MTLKKISLVGLLLLLVISYWHVSRQENTPDYDWDANHQNLPDREQLDLKINETFIIQNDDNTSVGVDIDNPIDSSTLEGRLSALTRNVTTLQEPTTEELAAFYATHQHLYRNDSRFSFRQKVFTTARHGGQAATVAEKALQQLQAGNSNVSGDPNILPEQFYNATNSEVDRHFGEGFADKLLAFVKKSDQSQEALPCWTGPVSSKLGVHLICLENASLGDIPPLEDIKPQVVNDWRYAVSQE